MSKSKIAMTLERYYDIAPNVRHFVLTTPEKFNFIPGQFVSIYIPHAGKEIRRSYSIANPPNDGYVEFVITYIPGGVATEYLFSLEAGSEVFISPAVGKLTLENSTHPQRYILIATGTGIAPYRSMLGQIQDLITTMGLKVVLLFGVRTLAEGLYYEEFAKFAAVNPNFDFRMYYSRENPHELQAPHQFCGHVQQAFTELNLSPEDMIYLCGNPNMIDESLSLLESMGVDSHKIRREKYVWGK